MTCGRVVFIPETKDDEMQPVTVKYCDMAYYSVERGQKEHENCRVSQQTLT